MNPVLKLRIGALCSFLFVALFVGAQVYFLHLASSLGNDKLPSQTKGSIDAQDAALLGFAHRHPDFYTSGSVLTGLGYLVLIGTVFAIYTLLVGRRPTAARITLFIGLVSILAVVIGLAVESRGLVDFSSRYVHAATAAARLKVVHDFKSQAGGYQILDIVGTNGIALWLALIGVTFLRLEGTRSMVGWATLAAGLLVVVQFPVLPVWALGAGIGLWRVSQSPYEPAPSPTPSGSGEVIEAESASVPARARSQPISVDRRQRQRTVATRGGAARRRKRR